jgi:hypothetical protein
MSLTSEHRGWSLAQGVETRTDKNGTSYQLEHEGQLFRVRFRKDGIVHLYLRGGHYAVTRIYQPPADAQGGRGTALDLLPRVEAMAEELDDTD